MNDADHAVAPMNPDPAKPPARARRLRTPYKLRLLDPALREEFDRRLREERWSCGELSQWLAERGAELSPSGVNYYYRHHFLPNLNAVKIACVETAAAVRESGGDDEAINRKLGSL